MLGAGRARAGEDDQRGDGSTWWGSRAHLPIHLRSQLSQDPGDRSQAGTYWSAKRSEARTPPFPGDADTGRSRVWARPWRRPHHPI